MDLEEEVLIGKEFWDMVGGNGTYEEILSIYQEVGKAKGARYVRSISIRLLKL